MAGDNSIIFLFQSGTRVQSGSELFPAIIPFPVIVIIFSRILKTGEFRLIVEFSNFVRVVLELNLILDVL